VLRSGQFTDAGFNPQTIWRLGETGFKKERTWLPPV
jgi:hypothetical protein